MSICTDSYRPTILTPRRIRSAECSAFQNANRWVNFFGASNLTPDPSDNDPSTGLVAWSLGDLPVTYAAQDVDPSGNDLLLVAIANRVYLLDWTVFRDQWNWDVYLPIYRRLTLGPIPANAEDAGKDGYDLAQLKRFRRLTFQLHDAPADPIESQYQVTVQDDATEATDPGAVGLRKTQQNADVKIAHRGYSFLATIEHEANEDFPLLWWTSEYEQLGARRRLDEIVTS